MINIFEYVDCLGTIGVYAFTVINIILFVMIILARNTNIFCNKKFDCNRVICKNKKGNCKKLR